MRDAVIARAKACIGVRFRPQGRDPAHGLDCAGLAAVAAGPVLTGPVAARYTLRGADAATIMAAVTAAGAVAIAPDRAGAGDLLLVRAGPRQFHLLVRTDGGFVHADAGLGRVVERPGVPPWPVIGVWRMEI